MNGELNEGEPMVITAAVFADGTEEGEQFSLDLLPKDDCGKRALLKERKGRLVPEKRPEQ